MRRELEDQLRSVRWQLEGSVLRGELDRVRDEAEKSKAEVERLLALLDGMVQRSQARPSPARRGP